MSVDLVAQPEAINKLTAAKQAIRIMSPSQFTLGKLTPSTQHRIQDAVNQQPIQVRCDKGGTSNSTGLDTKFNSSKFDVPGSFRA